MLTSVLLATALSICAQPTTKVPVERAWKDTHATAAETSNWQATSTHAQVVAFLDRLADDAPEVARRISMGTSVEGRDMPVLVLSDPPVGTPQEARALAEKDGRVVVLAFGNIHAGEVDAKDAYLILARQLIEAHATTKMAGPAAPDANLLKKLIVLIAPIYNCDGNERFGDNAVNRPGQDGPTRMGQRHNAMDLDLNRDWGKLESPEARNIVALMNAWDPHVVIDGHTTDGSYHRYLMTYATPKALATDPRLVEFARDRMMPDITRRLRARTDIDTFWYGDFEGDHEHPPREHALWTTTPGMPRYSTEYIGVRGRIGILSESYTYSPFRDRVVGSLEFAREILRYSAEHAGEIRRVTSDASAWRGLVHAAPPPHVDAGAEHAPLHAPSTEIVIRTQPANAPGESIAVKGYVEETRDGRAASTNVPHDYPCALQNRLEPMLAVKRPIAYVFTADVPGVVENLRLHGVRITTLDKETAFDAEVYAVTKATRAPKAWQGHNLMTLEASAARERITAPKGAVYVPTDQPLGNLVCYWLEPQSEDGLANWNFFDAWATPGEKFPVVRVLGP